MNNTPSELFNQTLDALKAIQYISGKISHFSQTIGFYNQYNSDVIYDLQKSLDMSFGAFTNLLNGDISKKAFFLEEIEPEAVSFERDALKKDNCAKALFIESLEKKLSQMEETLDQMHSEEKKVDIQAFENRISELEKTLEEEKSTKESLVQSMEIKLSELDQNLSQLKEKDAVQTEQIERMQNEEKSSMMSLVSECQQMREKLHSVEEELALEKAQKKQLEQKSKAKKAKKTNKLVQEVQEVQEAELQEVQEAKGAEVLTKNPEINDIIEKLTVSYKTVCEKLDESNQEHKSQVSLPAPMVDGFTKAKKKVRSVKTRSPDELSAEELYELDWKSIKKTETYMTKFEVREGMEMDNIAGMKDPDVQVLWKNPDYFGGDDTPYKFIDMVPASNGFFYRYDPESGRYILAVYHGKFQKWDVSQY